MRRIPSIILKIIIYYTKFINLKLLTTIQINLHNNHIQGEMQKNELDIDKCLEQVKDCKPLSEVQVRKLCQKFKEIVLEESNIQPVSSPVMVAGDVHGQFYDVLQMFRIGGEIPTSKYIMIGDFVDRGYHSVQTISLLFCLKLKYPDLITLLRGNHECRNITIMHGFYDEITRKYGNTNVWKYFTDAFDYLPLGAVIDGEIFCVHGGLSPQLRTIDQMRVIKRNIQIPHEGPMADLMWSDPQNVSTWRLNTRGAGYLFGDKVVKDFNHINGIRLIARAHQLVNDGYEYWFDKQLVTVWSAPNYVYRSGNKASLMKVHQGQQQQFLIFDTVPQSRKSEHFRNLMPYFL